MRRESVIRRIISFLTSLGRKPFIRLNIMYYERRRHYNPILNAKAAGFRGGYCVACNVDYHKEITAARKNVHAVMPLPCANPPTRA